jgi:hypothetical protein
MKVLLTAAVLGCVSLSGCSTIYRTVSLDSKPATSIDIDAKARMIVVTDYGGKDGNRRVICSEPSPDTAVGIASSTSLAANVAGKVDAQLAASLAEAVQSVGRRTQSIQLLRDGLYRACEAYLNGAITANEYRLLLSRISAFAITLVAVDGLTGGQGISATSIATKANAKTGTGSSDVKGGVLPISGGGPATGTGLEAGTEAGSSSGQAGAPTPPVVQDNVSAVTAIVQGFYDLQRHIYDTDLDMEKAAHAMTMERTTSSKDLPQKP